MKVRRSTVTEISAYTPTGPLYVVDYRFLKPSTAYIIPTVFQNVQLQVRLIPRMQENEPFSTIKNVHGGGMPPGAQTLELRARLRGARIYRFSQNRFACM